MAEPIDGHNGVQDVQIEAHDKSINKLQEWKEGWPTKCEGYRKEMYDEMKAHNKWVVTLILSGQGLLAGVIIALRIWGS